MVRLLNIGLGECVAPLSILYFKELPPCAVITIEPSADSKQFKFVEEIFETIAASGCVTDLLKSREQPN